VTPTTIPRALAAALARDPARPLLTYVGPGGERVELSVRTFENNVAKTANLLRDDADAGAGSVVVVDLPPHWQGAVWLGACAAVGALAWLGGDPASPKADVSVVGPEGLDRPGAPVALATALHPLGMPFARPLPAGLLDAAVEVRAHGDVFAPYAEVPGSTPWLRVGGRTWTQQGALADAVGLAERTGLTHGGRLLVTAEALSDDVVRALSLLAVPLAVDAAVVLLLDPGSDPADMAAAERCTAVLDGPRPPA
jgi:uncharacterized protein (TIGR03089 family)